MSTPSAKQADFFGRCANGPCNRNALVVVDYAPHHAFGVYRQFCWPCYWQMMRERGHPSIVNFIGADELAAIAAQLQEQVDLQRAAARQAHLL